MSNRLLAIFWALSGLLLLVRLVFIGNTMVIDDESYYLAYARHLNWGYIDHGPVVGWIIKLTTLVFGVNGFGVRVGGVLMITILAVVLYRFGKRHFGVPAGVALSLTVGANMFTHANSVIMTPDAPLAFFGILSIMMYYRAFAENRRHFITAGFLLGLAMLSKISALIPAAGFFLFPILSRHHRRFLRDPLFYASFVVALAVLVPFIIWNAMNDYAFFRYQGAHVARSGGIKSFLELWSGVMMLTGPVLFVYACIAAFRGLRRRSEDDAWQLFFGLVAVVPLLYFGAHSLVSRLELNWPAPALFGCIFLFGIAVGKSWPRRRKLFSWQIGYSLVLIVIITLQTFWRVLPLKDRADTTHRYYEYTSFRDELPALLHQHPSTATRRIAANEFQIPSMINLYASPSLEAISLPISLHESLYSFHYPDSTLVGEDFVVVVRGEQFPSYMHAYFEAYSKLGEIQSARGDKPLNTFSVWLADQYRGRHQ